MLILAYVTQCLLMLGTPLAVVLLLRRRWPVEGSWRLVGVGALGFVASQVVHIPLNFAVDFLVKRPFMPVPSPAAAPIVTAALLGTTAGLCEESVRWLVLVLWQRRARGVRAALALGAGHGGVEAALLGLSVTVSLGYMLAVRGAPPQSPPQLAQAVAAFWSAPPYLPIVGGLERVVAIALHLSLSSLVMLGVVRGRRRLLAAAIGCHALVDGVAVFLMKTRGVLVTEVAVALVTIAIAAAAWRGWRRVTTA